MSNLADCRPVTNAVTSSSIYRAPVTRLAKLYHYRRNGIYYLRLRETGSLTHAVSVSLKTTNRKAAMQASEHLANTIRAFHLDNPQATWTELREHLIWVAENLLSTAHELDSLRLWGDLYEDTLMDLTEISATMPLSEEQHEHIANAKRVMSAAQTRLQGDSMPLVTVIRELGKEGIPGPAAPTSNLPSGTALTFRILSELYLADRGADQKASTLKNTRLDHGVITTHIGELDLRNHSRADLVALRDRLSEGRMPSTVNKLIVKLSAVLAWAVDNGHLAKAYDNKLKFTKGVESSRKAFSQSLPDHTLPLSLGS